MVRDRQGIRVTVAVTIPHRIRRHSFDRACSHSARVTRSRTDLSPPLARTVVWCGGKADLKGGGPMHQSPGMQMCIDLCQSCAATCLTTVTHCLEKGGAHAKQDHVRIMLDCVDACETAARFMLRGSPLHRRYCGACEETCRTCATSCELGNDPEMVRCAEVCRSCADACRRMSG